MDLEFSIVLFENEGYATARGDKGVQDILAAKTEIRIYQGGHLSHIYIISILLEMVD